MKIKSFFDFKEFKDILKISSFYWPESCLDPDPDPDPDLSNFVDPDTINPDPHHWLICPHWITIASTKVLLIILYYSPTSGHILRNFLQRYSQLYFPWVCRTCRRWLVWADRRTSWRSWLRRERRLRQGRGQRPAHSCQNQSSGQGTTQNHRLGSSRFIYSLIHLFI